MTIPSTICFIGLGIIGLEFGHSRFGILYVHDYIYDIYNKNKETSLLLGFVWQCLDFGLFSCLKIMFMHGHMTRDSLDATFENNDMIFLILFYFIQCNLPFFIV